MIVTEFSGKIANVYSLVYAAEFNSEQSSPGDKKRNSTIRHTILTRKAYLEIGEIRCL